MSFQNTVEWLITHMRVTSTHVDYLKSGHAAVAVQFSGEPHLVRELLDRMCELSESSRPTQNIVDVLAEVQGNGG